MLEWYVLRDDGFEQQPVPDDGIYRSEAFPGLWLNSAAMLRRDGQTVMQDLQQGLITDDHATFAEKLEARRQQRP